jgi:hypothetical protein
MATTVKGWTMSGDEIFEISYCLVSQDETRGLRGSLHRHVSWFVVATGLANSATPTRRLGVDRTSREVLADRGKALLPEVVADIAAAGPVPNDHLMAALPTKDDAVKQGLATAGHASGLVAARSAHVGGQRSLATIHICVPG